MLNPPPPAPNRSLEDSFLETPNAATEKFNRCWLWGSPQQSRRVPAQSPYSIKPILAKFLLLLHRLSNRLSDVSLLNETDNQGSPHIWRKHSTWKDGAQNKQNKGTHRNRNKEPNKTSTRKTYYHTKTGLEIIGTISAKFLEIKKWQ